MDFYYLSDDDLGDLLAYVKSIPPVDRSNEIAENTHLTFWEMLHMAQALLGIS